MSNPTSNYNFQMPTSTDLVTDLPADFEVFGQAVDTQMKTNADAATQKATLTTKGDIYAATAASTPARLAVGSNDQVLTADSSTATGLKWAAAAGGSLTLISTTSLTGSSVTLSSIPQTYKMLRVIMKDYYHNQGAASTRTLQFTVNSTTGIYGSWNSFQASSGGSAAQDTKANIQNSVLGTAADNISIIDIYEYASTTTFKYADAKSFSLFDAATPDYQISNWRSGIRTTSAITSLTFSFDAFSFATAGTVELWGIN